MKKQIVKIGALALAALLLWGSIGCAGSPIQVTFNQDESSSVSSEEEVQVEPEEPATVTAYLASEESAVPLYKMKEDGTLADARSLPRGSEVQLFAQKFADEDGRLFVKVEAMGAELYVPEEAVVLDQHDCVQETKMYVRTPLTGYTRMDDCEIAFFAPKGTELEVLGFDCLTDDGGVRMYQVSMDGTTGWVFAKYLVRDEESAAEVYNENGLFDLHKKNVYDFDLYGGSPENLDYYPVVKENFEVNPFCADAHAMYLNCEAVNYIDDYIEIARNSGVNAVVLDIKDGVLAFSAQAAWELCPTAYKSAYVTPDVYAGAVQKLHDAGLYVIGRIVTFNDYDFAADHPEECIQTNVTDEKWVSAYSRLAWYYNVSLALECVENMPFNEIQFDYVRFPEDSYSMSEDPNTDFKNTYDEDKAEAIQNFLFYAADMLHSHSVYISADVFGEVANPYVTAYGQYWTAISNIVDAISGMPYTDHFTSEIDMWSDPYTTLYDWGRKAAARQTETPTPAAVRTWVTGYDTPYWDPYVIYDGQMIAQQAQALYDANLDGGFIPWNAFSSMEKYWDFGYAWNQEYTDNVEEVEEESEETEETEGEIEEEIEETGEEIEEETPEVSPDSPA